MRLTIGAVAGAFFRSPFMVVLTTAVPVGSGCTSAAGYMLANDGKDTRSIQDYLGHKNIRHTVRYTELSPNRFKDFSR